MFLQLQGNLGGGWGRTNLLVRWFAGWLVGWFVGWLIGCWFLHGIRLVGWLVSWLVLTWYEAPGIYIYMPTSCLTA